MTDSEMQTRILAFALHEVRKLLAGQLGSDGAGNPIAEAAHLAYALHNQALAVLHGEPFDVANAISSIAGVDRMFGGNLAERLAQATGSED